MEIKDKSAIITGISKGIGKSLTLQLLDKGVNVYGWGMNKPTYTHKNLKFFQVDVRIMASVNKAFELTLKQSNGKIDILINNAGLGYFGFLEDMPVEQWTQMFETNVYGVYFTSRMVIPVMKKQKSGHIINISSIAGLDAMPQVAAYCATKHAVKGMTESLFKELRDYGVKVTGIYPGSTKTSFFDNASSIDAHDFMMKADDVAKTIIQTLESDPNYLISQVVMRPLLPKGRNS